MQRRKRQAAADPVHGGGVRRSSLLAHKASKAAEERRCLRCHASGCCKHQGSETSTLDLSNASGILGLLRTFMLTIKTRELGVLIAGCMRVKHPNVEKGILAIVTPKVQAKPPRLDIQTGVLLILGRAKKISCLSYEIFDEIWAGGRIFYLFFMYSVCPVLTEGQNRCCTVNHWYMFGAYTCMQATKRARNSAQGKLLNFFPVFFQERAPELCGANGRRKVVLYCKSTATCLAPICMQWATERTGNSAQ